MRLHGGDSLAAVDLGHVGLAAHAPVVAPEVEQQTQDRTDDEQQKREAAVVLNVDQVPIAGILPVRSLGHLLGHRRGDEQNEAESEAHCQRDSETQPVLVRHVHFGTPWVRCGSAPSPVEWGAHWTERLHIIISVMNSQVYLVFYSRMS